MVVLTESPSVLDGGRSADPIGSWHSDQPLDDDGISQSHYALGDGQHLQILNCAIEDSAVVTAVIPLGLEGFDRLEAVHRFLSALHGRAIPPDTRLTRQQRARQRRMLRAFDGHRAGATQQEIAQAILKVGLVDRDEWQASSARHVMKALLRDARVMIAGGYRKLLRHRRRP